MKSIAAVCLLLALSQFAAAASDPCDTGLQSPLAADETLRLGTRSYALHIEAFQPEDVSGWDRLDVNVDLVVLEYDPVARETGPLTQPIALRGEWSWNAGRQEPTTGNLMQRFSSEGTALGFNVELQRPLAELEYTVSYTLLPTDGSCNDRPLTLSFVIPVETIEESVLPRFEPGIRSPGDNKRMNLLSQADLRPSDSSSDIWGYNDGTTYLAIMGSFNGTLFIDVTDPFNPVEVGFIGGPGSSWRDIKTYQNYAYIITEGSGTGQGLQIVDLSNPLSPVLVNTYAVNFATIHNIFIDEDRGHAWLVGTNNGARIVDLADPVNPVEIGDFQARYIHDVYVKNGFAYFSEIFSGIHETVDATDVSNLQILASWATPTNFTHNSWTNEDDTLIVTSDETAPGGHMGVYDISNKNVPPPLISEYIPNPASLVHNVFFDDIPGRQRVAMSHYALGVRYVDLQRPSIPIELGAYDTRASTDSGTSGCWGVYPFDPRGYIYASDIQSGLFVFEYAPTGGALTGVVRDEQTQLPIPGGAVQLLTHGSDLSINANGEFGEHLDAGDVVLRATAPGYASRIVVAGEMTVGGGIDVEIDLTPLPKGSVTGTVVDANTMAPISGAVVSVIDSTQQTTTNGSGQFTLPDIAIGQRIISVDKSGFSGDEATIVLQTGAVETVDFALLQAALVDDLELDTGWIRDSSDTATTGKWIRADPVGSGGGTIQPENDNTPAPGVNAYFTGQGLSGAIAELQDVDGGTASLLSPIIDLSGLPSPTFRYHRWFSSQAGSLNGGTFRIQVSDDAGSSWTTVEQLNSDANSWTPVSIPVSDYVTLNDQFRVRFACEAIPELDQQRILECAVDDIEVVQECRARAVVGGLDSDFDGVLDLCDACPFDPVDDVDGDGLCADVDNAPFVANPAQVDTDADGIGDLADNCPIDANAGQLDLDRDGLGNACDNDIDGDGDDDTVDLDDDNDGVLDVNDLCPTVADSAQLDFDGDSIGDACDDGDGRVHGVRIDGDLIQWQPESGASGYNLYRADLGAPILIQLAGCRAADLTQTQYTDTQLPQPGDVWAYLVAVEFGGVEQGVGAASDGTPRQVNNQCP